MNYWLLVLLLRKCPTFSDTMKCIWWVSESASSQVFQILDNNWLDSKFSFLWIGWNRSVHGKLLMQQMYCWHKRKRWVYVADTSFPFSGLLEQSFAGETEVFTSLTWDKGHSPLSEALLSLRGCSQQWDRSLDASYSVIVLVWFSRSLCVKDLVVYCTLLWIVSEWTEVEWGEEQMYCIANILHPNINIRKTLVVRHYTPRSVGLFSFYFLFCQSQNMIAKTSIFIHGRLKPQAL